MKRLHLKQAIDIVLLSAAAATFLSGLVLLADLHVGPAGFRTSALGITRLGWLNLHRLPGLLAVAALGLHLAVNWRPFAARLRRGAKRRRGRGDGPELALYVAFWTAVVTGVAAWMLVGGAAPLRGPAPLGPPPHLRHLLIEVHHLTGLVALPLAALHLARRWGPMARALRLEWLPLSQGAVPVGGRRRGGVA